MNKHERTRIPLILKRDIPKLVEGKRDCGSQSIRIQPSHLVIKKGVRKARIATTKVGIKEDRIETGS